MFYEEKDLNELLLCFNCKTPYKDPRILPCGETLCTACVTLLNDNNLKCPFCSDAHLTNPSDLQPNKTILKFLNKKPNEIYRGKVAEKLKIRLNEILTKTNELTNHINIGNDKIKDHCDNIRKEIQMVTEQAHQDLNENFKMFMGEIDDYEKETQTNVEDEDIYKTAIEKTLKEINSFRLKWMDYLENFIIDEDELNEAYIKSDECLSQLEKDILKLKERLFKGNLLKFEKSPHEKILAGAKANMIGALNIEKKNYLTKRFEELSTLKLQLADYKEKHALAVAAGINGSIFVVFQGEGKNLHLLSFNREGELLKQQLILLNFISFYDLKLICNKSAMFMYVSFYGPHYNGVNISTNYYYLLRRIDYNLNTDKEIQIQYNVSSLSSCSDKLYCLSNQAFDFSRVYIYDLNLDLIKSVGENDPKLTFYFPNSIAQIEVFGKNFFLLDGNILTILNLNNGQVLCKFPIVSREFKCYHQYVIAFDCENHEVVYYDLDGYIVFKSKICIESEVDFKILIDPDNDILLFDPEQLTIYF
jgi:predicted RNA-binding protein Jag